MLQKPSRARMCKIRHSFGGLLVGLIVATCVPVLAQSAAEAPQAAELEAPAVETVDPNQFTAGELVLQARMAFNEAQWPRAAALYGAFLENYGSAEEVRKLIPALRYEFSIALLQSKNFAEAGVAMEEAIKLTEPPLEPQQKQELAFWRGVIAMQQEEFPATRASLEEFIASFPSPQPDLPFWRMRNPLGAKIPEAQLLIGASFLLEGMFTEGVEYLSGIKPGLNEENRGRATILQLYGLLTAGENDETMRDLALNVVVEEFPRIDQLTQLAAFQTMTLQLGATFLEQGEYRKAIRCLQRIWPAERLLRHQETRLQDLEARKDALEANPRSDAYQKFLAHQMIVKVRREIDNFMTIENFDAALRLRLATAYQAMHRYREAALILDDMLERMDPNEIVEGASVNLVQCWNAIERWDRVIASAEKFDEVFPKSEQRPLVLYLKGIAQQQAMDYTDAMKTFAELQKTFPKSEYAGRAYFMMGFTSLLAEDNAGAIGLLTEFPVKHPDHDLKEPAQYWLGMAYSLDKQSEQAREVLAAYLKTYPQGAYAGEAQFRSAYAAHQMMDFDTSIAELRAFLAERPGHAQEAEALVLLGDALMNEGEIEEGMAVYARIPPEQARFFEEGWFKTGRALKLMEDFEQLKAHMLEFREKYPQSPRVAEALFHAGWVLRQQERDEEARQLYWDAIGDYIAEPGMRSVEDLFPALLRLYPGEEGARQFAARVRDLREGVQEPEPADDAEQDAEAGVGGQNVSKQMVLLRSLWAEALALRKVEPDRAHLLLVEAARGVDSRTTSPQLMADFADALLESGDKSAAVALYADLIKWNPRAPQKDRALAELGIIEKERGRNKAAMAHFERFMRETFSSRQTGRVLLAKGALEAERGQNADARASLEALLASEATTGQEKARALYEIGELFMRENKPALAQPYFQRLYIMHGRWRDWVAKAYLRSGEAFEKLGDKDAARRTFAEMLDDPGLADFPEFEIASKHLERLGGRITEPQPASGPATGEAIPEPPASS
jgi:tetratricopeptide (TPR) repeat protein